MSTTRSSRRGASGSNNNNNNNNTTTTRPTRSSARISKQIQNASSQPVEEKKKSPYAENLPSAKPGPKPRKQYYLNADPHYFISDLEGAFDITEFNGVIDIQIPASSLRKTAIYYSAIKRLLLLLKQNPAGDNNTNKNADDNNNEANNLNDDDNNNLELNYNGVSIQKIIDLQTLEMEKFKRNEHYKLFNAKQPELISVATLSDLEQALYNKVIYYFAEATKTYDRDLITLNPETIKNLFYAYYACCKLKAISGANQKLYAENALRIAIYLEHVIERHARLIKADIAEKQPYEVILQGTSEKQLWQVEYTKIDMHFVQFFEDFSSENPFKELQKGGTKSFNSPTALQNQYARIAYPNQAKFGSKELPEDNGFRIQQAHRGSRYTVTEHGGPQLRDSIRLEQQFKEYETTIHTTEIIHKETNEITYKTDVQTKKIGETAIKSTELKLLNPFDLHANINAKIIVELLSLEQFTLYIENFLNLCEKLTLARKPDPLSTRKRDLKQKIELNDNNLRMINDLYEQMTVMEAVEVTDSVEAEEEAEGIQRHIINLYDSVSENNNNNNNNNNVSNVNNNNNSEDSTMIETQVAIDPRKQNTTATSPNLIPTEVVTKNRKEKFSSPTLEEMDGSWEEETLTNWLGFCDQSTVNIDSTEHKSDEKLDKNNNNQLTDAIEIENQPQNSEPVTTENIPIQEATQTIGTILETMGSSTIISAASEPTLSETLTAPEATQISDAIPETMDTTSFVTPVEPIVESSVSDTPADQEATQSADTTRERMDSTSLVTAVEESTAESSVSETETVSDTQSVDTTSETMTATPLVTVADEPTTVSTPVSETLTVPATQSADTTQEAMDTTRLITAVDESIPASITSEILTVPEPTSSVEIVKTTNASTAVTANKELTSEPIPSPTLTNNNEPPVKKRKTGTNSPNSDSNNNNNNNKNVNTHINTTTNNPNSFFQPQANPPAELTQEQKNEKLIKDISAELKTLTTTTNMKDQIAKSYTIMKYLRELLIRKYFKPVLTNIIYNKNFADLIRNNLHTRPANLTNLEYTKGLAAMAFEYAVNGNFGLASDCLSKINFEEHTDLFLLTSAFLNYLEGDNLQAREEFQRISQKSTIKAVQAIAYINIALIDYRVDMEYHKSMHEAIEKFEAFELNLKDPRVYYNLALMALILNNFSKASAYIEEAMNRYSGNDNRYSHFRAFVRLLSKDWSNFADDLSIELSKKDNQDVFVKHLMLTFFDLRMLTYAAWDKNQNVANNYSEAAMDNFNEAMNAMNQRSGLRVTRN